MTRRNCVKAGFLDGLVNTYTPTNEFGTKETDEGTVHANVKEHASYEDGFEMGMLVRSLWSKDNG